VFLKLPLPKAHPININKIQEKSSVIDKYSIICWKENAFMESQITEIICKFPFLRKSYNTKENKKRKLSPVKRK